VRVAEERAAGLQVALTQLQLVAEKRQAVEQQMRHSLEDEIRAFKTQQQKVSTLLLRDNLKTSLSSGIHKI
jgi:hypothetical protein